MAYNDLQLGDNVGGFFEVDGPVLAPDATRRRGIVSDVRYTAMFVAKLSRGIRLTA